MTEPLTPVNMTQNIGMNDHATALALAKQLLINGVATDWGHIDRYYEEMYG